MLRQMERLKRESGSERDSKREESESKISRRGLELREEVREAE